MVRATAMWKGWGMRLPDPSERFPIRLPDGSPHCGTVHLGALDLPDNLSVGAWTYASDLDPPDSEGWVGRLFPYLFPFSRERVEIGRFCQIAHGARILTSSANHRSDGISTFPFPIYDPDAREGYQPDRRDTVIGHDVWIGHGATVLPGARIGSGVIVGAGAVVGGTVPDYAVVAGNRPKVLRMRFGPAEVRRLLALAWWDRSAEWIGDHRALIESGDVAALEAAVREPGVPRPSPDG